MIPRAVREIFDTIKRLQEEANGGGRPAPTFEIHVQFLEVIIHRYILWLYMYITKMCAHISMIKEMPMWPYGCPK